MSCHLRYGDIIGKTAEENSNFTSLIWICCSCCVMCHDDHYYSFTLPRCYKPFFWFIHQFWSWCCVTIDSAGLNLMSILSWCYSHSHSWDFGACWPCVAVTGSDLLGLAHQPVLDLSVCLVTSMHSVRLNSWTGERGDEWLSIVFTATNSNRWTTLCVMMKWSSPIADLAWKFIAWTSLSWLQRTEQHHQTWTVQLHVGV